MRNIVRQILTSVLPININPSTIVPQASAWSDNALTKSTINGVTTLIESATFAAQAILISSPIVDGGFYSYSVWARGGARRLIYLGNGTPTSARIAAVWGLDGQGLIQTRQSGATIDSITTEYKRFGKGIYKCTLNFRCISGGSGHNSYIEIVDTIPPVFVGASDVVYTGNGNPSLEIHGVELVRTA